MSGNYNQHSLSSLSSVSGSAYSGGSSQYGGGSGYYNGSGQYSGNFIPTYGFMGAPLSNPQKPVRPFFPTNEGIYKLIKELPIPKLASRRFQRISPPKITSYYQPGKSGVMSNTSLNSNSNNSYSNNSGNYSSTSSITIKNLNNSSTSFSNASYSSSYSEQSDQHSSTSSVINTSQANSNKPIIQTTEKEILIINLIHSEQIFTYSFTNIDETAFEDKSLQILNRQYGSPTCIKFNKKKQDSNRLQTVIGLDTGDIVYCDPQQKGSAQLIRNKCRFSSSHKRILEDDKIDIKCTSVEWLPNSQNLFIATFSTGLMYIFDVLKQDFSGDFDTFQSKTFILNESQEFYIKEFKDPRINIISEWKISKKSINNLCFSPCSRYVAVACQDGFLHVYNIEKYDSEFSFKSYFGGVLSVDWSPDGKYIVTGGEDDYISIWSFEDRCLVARGQGHQSWVSCVKFDHFTFNSDQDHNKYRIVSGGEDTKLLLWDFAKESLKKPRFLKSNTKQQQPLPPKDQNNQELQQEQLSDSHYSNHNYQNVENQNPSSKKIIPNLSRMECPIILPIASHRVSSDSVSDLMITKDWIVTVSNTKVSLWARPDTVANAQKMDSLNLPNTPASYTKQIMMDGDWK